MFNKVKNAVKKVTNKVKNTTKKVKEYVADPEKREQAGIMIMFIGIGIFASGVLVK